MPKLLIFKNLVFLIYSIDLAENRKHIHIESRKGRFRRTAKFWLEPEIRLVEAGNFSKEEIRKIKKLIEQHKDLLIKQIDAFAKGEKIKTIKIF